MLSSWWLVVLRASLCDWRARTIKDVIGNTAGLKPNQLRRIEKLYTRRIAPHQILTPEFARQLAELSHEIRRQIGALIDRSGHIEYVMVGDNRRIELPDFKRIRVAVDRFRGLRCVHTHLRGEGLTQDDLTDLALLRLDLMVAVDVNPNDGLPGIVNAAHLLPMAAVDLQNGNGQEPYAFLPPKLVSQLDVDFLELIESLEQEMARNRRVQRLTGGRELPQSLLQLRMALGMGDDGHHPRIQQPLRFCLRAIVSRDPMAGLHQVGRHRPAHVADADEGDGQRDNGRVWTARRKVLAAARADN